jgi:hypothetical protein
MRKLTVVMLMAIAMGACGQPSPTPRQADTNIVAGPNEQNFAQRYDPTMTLPMAETAFVRKLDQLGLPYELQGQGGTAGDIEQPRLSTSLDLSKVTKVYRIYGAADQGRQVTEAYRAFVDAQGQVVYVENNFQYTGP